MIGGSREEIMAMGFVTSQRKAMGLELEAMGFESQADNGDKVLEWTTNLRQDTDR